MKQLVAIEGEREGPRSDQPRVVLTATGCPRCPLRMLLEGRAGACLRQSTILRHPLQDEEARDHVDAPSRPAHFWPELNSVE